MLFDASSIQWLLKHLEHFRSISSQYHYARSVWVPRKVNGQLVSRRTRYRIVVLTTPLRQLLQLDSQSRADDV